MTLNLLSKKFQINSVQVNFFDCLNTWLRVSACFLLLCAAYFPRIGTTHTHTQWIKRFGERCLNMDRWLKRKTSSDDPDHDPKKKVSDPEKLTSSQTEDPQKNEVKQSKDKFQTNWLKIYPWLEINDGIMSCSDCKIVIKHSDKTCISWMHCKSLWIKASAKCINVNVRCTAVHNLPANATKHLH